MIAQIYLRLFALVGDIIVCLAGEGVILFFLIAIENLMKITGVDPLIYRQIIQMMVYPSYALFIIFPWLYHAILESDPRRKGTFGKTIFEISVVDINKQPISFWRASLRYWSKLLSAGLFLMGFIIALFTPKKQALHDIIAGTIVIISGKDTSQER